MKVSVPSYSGRSLVWLTSEAHCCHLCDLRVLKKTLSTCGTVTFSPATFICWHKDFFFFLFTIAWRGINGSLEHTEGNQYIKLLHVFKQKGQWKLCKVDFVHCQRGKSLERFFLNCQYFEFMLAARTLLAAFIKLKHSRRVLGAALLVISCGKLRDVSTI